MAPSACLSPVVTLALLLLITGFALGGHHTLSKKRHNPHTMIARFLPLANDSAVSSPDYRSHHRQSQGHNISARWSAKCTGPYRQRTYTVVLWTTDRFSAGMDGDVRIRLVGDKCQTGWHNLDHPWINDFERGARDDFTFHDNDIGSKITEACVHVTGNALFHMTWHLNKVDTYYKNRKRPFYWNNWSPIDATYRLKETGSNAFAVTASMTTVVVFVVTTWFLM